MPDTQRILTQMGSNIKMARLRRGISMETICLRAGISRATLWKIENGSPSVSLGAYAASLHALYGMDKELLKVASDDELGRLIQDRNLVVGKRARKKAK